MWSCRLVWFGLLIISPLSPTPLPFQGRGDAAGLPYSSPISGRGDAAGLPYSSPISGRGDATGLPYSSPISGRGDGFGEADVAGSGDGYLFRGKVQGSRLTL